MIARPPFASARTLTAVLLATAGLAACATPMPTKNGSSLSSKSAPPARAWKDKDGNPLRGTMKPYQVKGTWYYPQEQPRYDETGIGSWYGEQFHNRYTANGEIFDMDLPSAAHKTLPLPSIVEVKNLDNGRTMRVRVNDRGPFVDKRIIDLSKAAADELGFKSAGVARVRVRYIGPAGKPTPFDQPKRYAKKADPRPVMVAAAPPPPPAYAPPAYEPAPYVPPARAPVQSGTLPPIGSTASYSPPVAVAQTTSSAYRVQAGAFSSRANAERAVQLLSDAGLAVIEPTDRGGVTLYRVVMGPAADESAALELRDAAAAFGFPDATVLRPF
ncbi:septal ring lytic transglycosylase RlpA family protein [Caulobacter segnis]|uniref:septal ring lytic transglycosylase RlpA family protein n=1 Tax=Caulobacter segnis TaxID=88688 RepID=UPI00240FDF98|nr:septal ring lytic transglycosylase RlpA family protein [Caulobacter segnis]MDG2522205.1 septal ring lytic transglycosylase RlpA family protein [Caulobacter segnis]